MSLQRFFSQLLVMQYDFQPLPPETLVKAAKCQAAYVVRGLTTDELQRLEAAIHNQPEANGDIVLTTRQSPEDAQALKELMRRVRQRSDEARTSAMCDPRRFE